VGRRLLDTDTQVRRAALDGAQMLAHDAPAQAALCEVLQHAAEDRSAPVALRHAALEAIADLRLGAAIPALTTLLADAERDVARSAEWALGVIARQNFGSDAKRWSDWWRQHGSRHRVDWLIDALMHDETEIRRAAGEELKTLTKEYFGYYDDLPKKERARAQKRYREWWESRGKRLFKA
jgi:HEAT repeat protein